MPHGTAPLPKNFFFFFKKTLFFFQINILNPFTILATLVRISIF